MQNEIKTHAQITNEMRTYFAAEKHGVHYDCHDVAWHRLFAYWADDLDEAYERDTAALRAALEWIASNSYRAVGSIPVSVEIGARARAARGRAASPAWRRRRYARGAERCLLCNVQFPQDAERRLRGNGDRA